MQYFSAEMTLDEAVQLLQVVINYELSEFAPYMESKQQNLSSYLFTG